MNEKTCLPDPERPLMIMRLRSGHESKEVWARLFPQLTAAKAGCDEVWFSTGVGVPLLTEHQRRSALMAEHAENLRKSGIIPSLQIQSTIGHSDDISAAAGVDGKSWGSYVGVNGEKCRYINCPRQEGFLEYLRRMSEIYAQWHPGSVWIDDDLRLYNHAPASAPCGCYCEDCLAIFSKEQGHDYTREELVEAYRKDPALYECWKNFGERTLVLIVKNIVEAFLKVSPETRFGLQHGMPLARIPVMEAICDCAGSVGSRPGAGTYSDHDPYAILDKMLAVSMQIVSQPGYEKVSQIAPEIESCPRSFTCKTSHGHRLESLLYLAAGSDSLSYFIMDPMLETPEWYGSNLLKPLAQEAPCYKEFIQHNLGTCPGGIGVAARDMESFVPVRDIGLPLVGVPFAAMSKANCGVIITRTAAEKYPEAELEKLFRSGCMLDGYAAMALQQRGLEHLLGNIRVEKFSGGVSEYYTQDPLNEGFETCCHNSLNRNLFRFEVPENMEYRALGIYRDVKKAGHGAASMLFTAPAGGRCALFGYEGFNIHFISSDRVRMLNRAADWVSGGRLPVISVEPQQILFVPAVTEKQELRSVTILNPTIGIQKSFEVRLRGVGATCREICWCVPGEVPVPLKFIRESNECRLIVPEMAAWAVGWLKIAP